MCWGGMQQFRFTYSRIYEGDNVKISVIIPCFNVEQKLINRCVDSLLEQTLNEFEIIIIDDGSEAEYSKYLLELEEKHERIKVYYQSNSGVSSARNKGTSIATGDYVCYVDADDYVANYFLQEAYMIAVENQADFVIGGNANIGDDAPIIKKRIVDILHGEEIREIYKYLVGNRLLSFADGVYVGQGPWTRLIKSSLAKKIKFDTSLKIGEDVVWNYNLLENAKCVCMAHSLWYFYYTNPVSASRKYREDAVEESSKSLLSIRNCLDLSDDEIYRSYCSRCLSDIKRLYYTYFSKTEKKDKDNGKSIYCLPWSESKSKRYFSLCSKKEKVVALMYRYHLLFAYYRLKDFLHR